MKTKLVRVGNSRGIRIPQGLLELYAIEEGDALELEETREGILIRSSEERPRKPPSRLSGPLGTRSAGTVWMIDRYGIYWVDLDSVEGSEFAKKRPAVVVSDEPRIRDRRGSDSHHFSSPVRRESRINHGNRSRFTAARDRTDVWRVVCLNGVR